MVRLVVTLLLGAACAVPGPAAYADDPVQPNPPLISYAGPPAQLFAFVTCSARAPGAAWTQVICEVGGTHWPVGTPFVDVPPVPRIEAIPIDDGSETTASGEAAVAFWEGSVAQGTLACTIASAAFNQTNGDPPVVFSAPPLCRPVG
jgi:hypothetical protein